MANQSFLLKFRVAWVYSVFTFALSTFAAAQTKTVSGTVRSAIDNQPLTGVTIHVSQTNNGTVTNNRGHYQLTGITSVDTLVFSYIGFEDKKLIVGNKTQLDVALKATAAALDQIVVIGYGTAKKKDLTGSVATIEGSTFKNQAMTQITGMLTGTVAGVNVSQGTKAAGGGSHLEIRGRTSLTASNAPMIVIDGAIFDGSLADINPIDVQSIDILKDASSAAIYGARASNGVIMITTRKGKKGKPTIHFTTKIGISEVAHAYKPYGPKEYLQFKMDLLKGWGTGFPDYYFDNPNNLPDNVTIDDWRNASSNPLSNNTKEWLNRLRFFPTEIKNYMAGKTTNWYGLVTQKGLRQSYDVSISGGADGMNYYWSGGYVNNKGIISGDKFSAIRTRLNLDFKIAKWMDVGLHAQFSHRIDNGVPADLNAMYRASPYGSLYDTTGQIKFYPNDYIGGPNPLVNTLNQERSDKSNDLFANIYANLDLPFGVEYKISFQPHYQFGHSYNFWPSESTLVGSKSHTNGYGTRYESRNYSWIIDNIVHWDKIIGIHSIDLTVLYSSEEHNYWSTSLTSENFSPNQNLGYNALQFGVKPTIDNNDTRATANALMARINYSLLDKYLLTLSIRKDGYSAFGQKNPTATFPAAALAWRVSKENFFSIEWIDNMKLRLSWGVNGNRDIGTYASLAKISSNLYYDGSNLLVGVYNNSLANPNLSWERTTSFNYGVDVSMFNSRLSVTANYYSMQTTDLLMDRVLPAITGFDNITTNLGEVDNHGIELTINSINVEQSDFNWKSGFVFSLNRNKIKRLFGDYKEVTRNGKIIKIEVPDYTNGWFPGKPIGVVWDYNVIGVWQLDEKAKAESYNMEPGDYKAEDVNNDGSYQALDDKQFIGNTVPRYRLGLRNTLTFFHNLTISLFIRANLGHIKPFPKALHTESSEFDRRNIVPPPDYWTPNHPINTYSRILNKTVAFGGGLMIYRPASFVRVQDFTVSYNLSNNFIKKIEINNFRVFGSIRNLYTFTNWPGWDPEAGDTPMPRVYTLGLSFSL